MLTAGKSRLAASYTKQAQQADLPGTAVNETDEDDRQGTIQ